MDIADIDFEALKDRGLYIATPMYGGQCFSGYAFALAKLSELCGAGGIKLHIDFPYNSSLIPLARNLLANRFLETDCEHLLFWDADVEIAPANIFKLMAHQADNPAYDIIGAAYPVKRIRWDVVEKAVHAGFKGPELQDYAAGFPVLPIANATYDDGLNLNAPMEVESITTGMMMIRRSVLERFANEYPDLRYWDTGMSSNIQVSFFDCGVDAES